MKISKTDMNVTVKDVTFGEETDVVVTTIDSEGEHEWIVQTHNGRYDYSAGCLLFVDGEEFDYSWEGEDWDAVYQNHLDAVVAAADGYSS